MFLQVQLLKYVKVSLNKCEYYKDSLIPKVDKPPKSRIVISTLFSAITSRNAISCAIIKQAPA